MRQRLRPADDFEVVLKFAGVGEERGNGFCGVERAAAAEADHEVAGVRAGVGGGANDIVGRRLVCDGGGGHGESGGREKIEEALSTGGIAAGDNERASTERGRGGRDGREGAGAEGDLLRGGEVEAHRSEFPAAIGTMRSWERDLWEPRTGGSAYQAESSGWRLVNLVLVRGSAIIDATASRHVA